MGAAIAQSRLESTARNADFVAARVQPGRSLDNGSVVCLTGHIRNYDHRDYVHCLHQMQLR
jgi:hypothetical protein